MAWSPLTLEEPSAGRRFKTLRLEKFRRRRDVSKLKRLFAAAICLLAAPMLAVKTM